MPNQITFSGDETMRSQKSNNRYLSLHKVLTSAFDQAAIGKGKIRHASGEPFEQQQICQMQRWLTGSLSAGPLFQAAKKIFESSRLEPNAAIHELQGAIIYISAAIILYQETLNKEQAHE